EQVQDSFTLQEFGSRSSSEGALSSRLTLAEACGRSGRRGYHRLQGEAPAPEESTSQQPPSPSSQPSTCSRLPAPQTEPVECSSPSSSTESSSDYERDYFGGFTDTDDEDEELTCNVCERSFNTVRRLEQHQQRKRHYGCSICDSIFPGLMALELHKETLDHWSDYELRVKKVQEDERESDSEDELEEHRVYSGKGRDELRRLLL
ncbi:uncharacterized protein LOC118186123, partial [Stegodyphus dumicola]|uniref:uncharacterized protein LOC118186123 n=1 Tax=Stegodyphus dumicola TaxID=202533 RepID=UPI0015A9EC92